MDFEVVVVGSSNVDIVAVGARLPAPGETVLCDRLLKMPGGKGANQATAAARAGARTALISAVGDDADSAVVLDSLAAAGAHTGFVRRHPGAPTGTALIVVGAGGENQIAVVPGANSTLDRLTERERAAIQGARVVLIQLEIPLGTVEEAARLGHDAGAVVILNAAPVALLPDELLLAVTILLVNQSEAAVVGGLDRAAATIVTRGRDGATYRSRDGREISAPARAVEAVDTTGAGDTFAGYLAAALAQHLDVRAALELAVAAASLSVTRSGAAAAIPTRSEVLEWR